jgi:hypothetical protein
MPHLLSLPQFLASHSVEIRDAIIYSPKIDILTCLQKKIIVADEEEIISLMGFLSSPVYAAIPVNTPSKETYLAIITTMKARILILGCCSKSSYTDILLVLEKITL